MSLSGLQHRARLAWLVVSSHAAGLRSRIASASLARSMRAADLPSFADAVCQALDPASLLPLFCRHEALAEIGRRAENAKHHRLRLYNVDYELGQAIPWQRDPDSRVDLAPADKRDFGFGRANVKTVWKLSCGHHMLDLALTYVATGNADCADSLLADILDWISHNRDKDGVNWWSPTEVAIRMAVWSLALVLVRDRALNLSPEEQSLIITSLDDHVRYVVVHIENQMMKTNHFIANTAGLYLASVLFPGLPSADKVAAFAQKELEREIASQVCTDGTDFEFSSHYHRFVTEMFLYPLAMGAALGRHPFSQRYRGQVNRMVNVLERLVSPGGILPQIGDNDSETLYFVNPASPARDAAAFIQTARANLSEYPAASCPQANWLTLPAPGWHIHTTNSYRLTAVCGRVGSRGLGAHDHGHVNELLLSVGGVEFIVDPGTGCYTADPACRNSLRSARAHSVLFAGEEPASWKSGVNGLFYLRDVWRAHAQVTGDGLLTMRCRFGRYDWRRHVKADPKTVLVHDTVNRVGEGAFQQWVLHPDVRADLQDERTCLLTRADHRVQLTTDAAEWIVCRGPYSEHFGHVGDTTVIRRTTQLRNCTTRIEILDA